MRDELFDRDYQAGRDALHDGIDHLVAKTAAVFRAMARIRFARPWAARSRRAGSSHLA